MSKRVRDWAIIKAARPALKDWLLSKGVLKLKAVIVADVLVAVLKKELSNARRGKRKT